MKENNYNLSDSPNRKITLSCRVLPEQKFLIIARAKELGMSVSQYVEAKVLQEDNLELEKIIQRLKIEQERLQVEKENLLASNSKLKDQLNQIQNDYDSFYQESIQQSHEQYPSFKILFWDENQKRTFMNKLQQLAKKYHVDDLQTILKLSLEYTYKNDNAIFFLETVKGFFKENLNNHNSKNQKIIK